MRSRILAATVIIALAACGGSRDEPGATPDNTESAAPAAPSTAVTEPAAPVAESSATTEGSITATVGGEAMTFRHLPADSNYVLATNFGLLGTTEAGGGAELKIVGMFQTVSSDGPFPLVLEAEDTQVYFERARKTMQEGGKRSLQRQLMVLYTASDGSVHFGGTVLTVTAYDGSKIEATFAATLKPKKGKGPPIELTDGSREVVTKTPAAGRVVEKVVTGR